MRLYTIGHSTRTLDELVEALTSFDVRLLIDIRTIPRSRHAPQFNGEALRRELPRRGIRYMHLAALGGFRRPRPDSRNTAWRHPGFRGFADYMETDEFAQGLRRLRAAAADAGPAAIMCAEAVPWRCHRSLVADALTARGDAVLHIMIPGKAQPHDLTPWARIGERRRVDYSGEQPPVPGGRQGAVRTPSTKTAGGRGAGPARAGRRSTPRAEQRRLL